MMTGEDITKARRVLGIRWNLGRPLYLSELGRLLRLSSERPGETVRLWENGHNAVTGPVSVAIEAMLEGWLPSNLGEVLDDS